MKFVEFSGCINKSCWCW